MKTTQRGYAAALALAAAGGAATGGIGQAAGSAAWLCCIAGGAAGAVFFLMLGAVSRMYECDSFFGMLRKNLGKIPGRIVSLVISAAALMLCAHEAALVGEFITTTVLESTSLVFAAGALLAVCVFAAASGEAASARWAEVMMPPIFAAVLLSLMLAAPDFRMQELRIPQITHKDALRASAEFFLFSFAGSIGCAVLMFDVQKKRGTARHTLLAALAAAGITALLYLANVALLGANMPQHFNFPTYHALRVIGLSSLEVRFEALLMLPLVLMGFVRAETLLLMARRGFEETLGLKPSAVTVYILAALSLVGAWALYPNQSVLNASAPYIAGLSIFVFVLPLTVAALVGYIRMKLRKKKSKT